MKSVFTGVFILAFPITLLAAEIPTVYVAPPKTPSLSLSGGSKTVLTQEQMNATGITSISQALQSLGGVQLQDMTGNSNQVLLSMRGFGANAGSNTLLLINGIPITNPDLAPPDLNAVPLNAIQYIEIISGSESVLYGDQAVGGIINIVTRDTSQHKFTLDCGTGSYSQYRCSFVVNEKLNQWRTYTALTKSHTANYRDRNQYNQNLLTGNVTYSAAHANVFFDYKLADEYLQFPGALTAAEVSQNRRQAEYSSNFFGDWSGFFHLRYTENMNAIWQIQMDLARREMHGHGVLISPFTQSRVTHYAKPQWQATLDKLIVQTGIDLENDSYRLASDYGLSSDTQHKYGAFSLAKYFLTNNFAAAFGLRAAQQDSHLVSFSNNDNFNRAFVSTLGITYQVSPVHSIYLRRADTYRFPKADENAATSPGVNGLKTQRGASYETGIEAKHANFTYKLDIYQLLLRDEISFDPTQTPQAPFGTNVNLAPTLRQGLTLAGRTNLIQQLSLNGQINLVEAHFQNGLYAGKRIPLVSEANLHTGINYTFHDNWNWYSEAVFTGNQYSDSDNANIAGRIGGYTVYNVNLGYTRNHFNLNMRINNLFNKYYYLYTVLQSPEDGQFFYPAAGRNFTLDMTYRFL